MVGSAAWMVRAKTAYTVLRRPSGRFARAKTHRGDPQVSSPQGFRAGTRDHSGSRLLPRSPEHRGQQDRVRPDRQRVARGRASAPRDPVDGAFDLTIVEMLAQYKRFAVQHYKKSGARTHEWDNLRYAIEPLKRLYGRNPGPRFRPVALAGSMPRNPVCHIGHAFRRRTVLAGAIMGDLLCDRPPATGRPCCETRNRPATREAHPKRRSAAEIRTSSGVATRNDNDLHRRPQARPFFLS